MTWQHLVCVDLEATCSENNTMPRREMEIIEIGAVVVDQRFQPVGEFQTFIRPVRHAQLTPFCRELTSITQAQVDQAPTFFQAWVSFSQWLRQLEPYIWTSWGAYDANQFGQDLDFHGIDGRDVLRRHLNAKSEFSRRQGLRSRVGLKAAVEQFAGMRWEGRHHRGLDDARNLARLMPYVMGEDQIDRSDQNDKQQEQ